MPNRQELTDYAVSLLKESNEDAGSVRASGRDGRAGWEKTIRSIRSRFAIPLFVIGAILCATGILAGVGLGIIGNRDADGVVGVGGFVLQPRSAPREQAGVVVTAAGSEASGC